MARSTRTLPPSKRRRAVTAGTAPQYAGRPDAEIFRLLRLYNQHRDNERKARNAEKRAASKLPESLRYPSAYAGCWQAVERFCAERAERLLKKAAAHDTRDPAEVRAEARRMKQAARLVTKALEPAWRATFKAYARCGARKHDRQAHVYSTAAERVRQRILAYPVKTAKGLQAKWHAAHYQTERLAVANEMFAIMPDVLPASQVVTDIINTPGNR